jgi:hypothetical protein
MSSTSSNGKPYFTLPLITRISRPQVPLNFFDMQSPPCFDDCHPDYQNLMEASSTKRKYKDEDGSDGLAREREQLLVNANRFANRVLAICFLQVPVAPKSEILLTWLS